MASTNIVAIAWMRYMNCNKQWLGGYGSMPSELEDVLALTLSFVCGNSSVEHDKALS